MFELMSQEPIVAILFGILMLSVMPAIVSNLPFKIQQSASAQNATTMTEASSSPTINNNQNNITNITTTESEITEETGLPRQEGFSVRVLATNFSAPIIYSRSRWSSRDNRACGYEHHPCRSKQRINTEQKSLPSINQAVRTVFCWEDILPSNSTNGISIAWYRRD